MRVCLWKNANTLYIACFWNLYLSFLSLIVVLINDSTENLRSFLHRGLLYAQLRLWRQATADFEAVIKLDRWPLCRLSFCLLLHKQSKVNLSLLNLEVLWKYRHATTWLEVFESNIESVFFLRRSVAVAYVSLGLISMLKMNRNYEAIKRFSDALKEDPSCVRACVCRAKAYYNVRGWRTGSGS